MWHVLVSSLGRRRRDLAALAVWAAIEALPAYLSGRLVALATDRGFLARRPGTGFAWLGLLGVAVVLGLWALPSGSINELTCAPESTKYAPAETRRNGVTRASEAWNSSSARAGRIT